MNRNTILGTLGVSLLLILMGMVSESEIPHDQQSNSSSKLAAAEKIEKPTEIKMSKLIKANNCFGFKLFRQIQTQNRNVVISPNSVAIALSMTLNGMDGATLEETTTALELESLEIDTVNTSYLKLIETLQSADSDVELAIANSLWINQDISLKHSFIAQAKQFYQAQVTSLDFTQSEAKNTINEWVAQSTADKIPEIVDSVAPEDILYLINAVYFRANWATQFEPDATTEQPFYIQPNAPIQKAMMSQTGDYRYYDNEQFQAIRLPYGERQELSMYIFLPSQNSNLAKFNQQLNIENWQEWISLMRSQPGNISLPRFKLEYETELQNALAALGMKQMFNSSQADFSLMTDFPVEVDKVKHKTFIEVNEKGTEAAAATSLAIRATSAMPKEQAFNMNVNRPFFFAIRDDITESILFVGNIVEPN